MSSDMQELLLYMSAFFMVFLSCVVVSLCLRMVIWIYLEYWRPERFTRRRQRERETDCNLRQRIRSDRQGNIFTISDETAANTNANRFPDFFYIDPNGAEADRIRTQLEKDDKDLPSYEDVIRMTSNVQATPDNSALPATITATGNSTTVNTVSLNDLGAPPPLPPDLLVPPPPVPPYSEIDPNAPTTSNSIPSTSRGASVTIPIENSVSKTSV